MIKPILYSKCFRCQQTGHKASAEGCPAKAPLEVQQSTEAFQGSSNPLSNLHVCPEGCSWETQDGQVFTSSEQEFQFEKVLTCCDPDKVDDILACESGMEAKKEAD